jgi:hypothetical protein
VRLSCARPRCLPADIRRRSIAGTLRSLSFAPFGGMLVHNLAMLAFAVATSQPVLALNPAYNLLCMGYCTRVFLRLETDGVASRTLRLCAAGCLVVAALCVAVGPAAALTSVSMLTGIVSSLAPLAQVVRRLV